MKRISFLLPLVVLAALGSLGRSQVIPVGNYSFTSPGLPGTYTAGDPNSNYDASQTEEEYSLVPGVGGIASGSGGGGGATNVAIPDWTATSTGGVIGVDNPVDGMYAGTGGGSSDGVLPGTAAGYTFALMNVSASGDSGTLTYSGPSLGNFVVGQSYQLTVAIGLRLDETSEGSPDYTIELLDTDPTTLLTSVIASSSGEATLGTFTDLSLTTPYTDDAYTGAIGIAIVVSDNSDSFQQGTFDNVRLVETPEPATYAEIVGGLAILGVLAYRRRSLA